jgi:hypothetical protein
MRGWSAILGFLAAMAQAHAAGCAGIAERKLVFSNRAAMDTFVVESFGPRCEDARVVIYLKTPEQGWHVLHLAELSNLAASGVTPQTLAGALKEIADRIEGPRLARLETWAELERAASQPDGMPWRGTPLVKAEYERLYKRKPRFVIVPTDASRGMMLVWDDEKAGRPVEYVHYGD